MSDPQRAELEEKLIALFNEQPDLFEEIRTEKYYSSSNPELMEDDLESLYCDGQAGLLLVEGKTYRFRYEELEPHIGEEIYDWY